MAAANGALMGDAASQRVSQKGTGVGAADSAVANPAAAAAQTAVAGADTTAAANAAASAATDAKRSSSITPAAAAAKAAVAGTIAAGAAANGALMGDAASQPERGTGVYVPGGSGQLTRNEVKLLYERDAAEQAAQSWYQQCTQLRCQCDDLRAQCNQAWATAQKNHLSACHWKATAEAAAIHQYHDQYQPPIPSQPSTLGATHPSSTLRPESVAIEPAAVPSSMAVDERSGMGTGRDRDRDNAAAANVAAAADAAADAALAAAATATKVAATARDTTQFRAAVDTAAAIAAP